MALPPIPEGFKLEQSTSSLPPIPEGFSLEGSSEEAQVEPQPQVEPQRQAEFPASAQIASRLIPGAPNLPGRTGDFIDSTKGAFLDSMGSMASAVGLMGSETADQAADYLYEQGDEARSSMTPRGREGSQKLWVNDDGSLGDAWGDVDAWVNLGGQTAGSLAAVITGGGPAKKGLEIGLKGIAKGMGKEVTQEGADRIGKYAGMGAYGAMEGLMMGGSAGKEVKDTIMEMPPEILIESPAFQGAFEEYLANGYSDTEAAEMARAALADSAAQAAGLQAGTVGVMLGTVAGKFIDDALTGRITDPLVGAASGAVVEGGTESLQGGGQQLIQNYNIGTADLTQDLTEGVANAAVAEGLGGGVAGGALGAVSAREVDDTFADVDIERAQEIASGMAMDLSESQEVGPAGPNFTMGDGFTMNDVPPEVTPGLDVGRPNQLDQSSSLMIEDQNIIYGQAPETTPPRNDALEGQFPQGYNVEQAGREAATDFVVDDEGNTEYTRERGVLVPEPQGPDFVGQEDAPPMTPAEALDKRDSEFKPLEDIEIRQQFNVEETGEMVEVSERADRLFSRIDKRRNVLTKLLECVG